VSPFEPNGRISPTTLRDALQAVVESLVLALADADLSATETLALALDDARRAAEAAQAPVLARLIDCWHESVLVRAVAGLPLEPDEIAPVLAWFEELDSLRPDDAPAASALCEALLAPDWWTGPTRLELSALAAGLGAEAHGFASIPPPEAVFEHVVDVDPGLGLGLGIEPEPEHAAGDLAELWISDAECGLVRQAIDDTLLPALALAVAGEPGDTAALDDARFQLDLLANACDHLGIVHAERALRACGEGLRTADPSSAALTAIEASSTLSDWLASPQDEGVQRAWLAAGGEAFAGLDAAASAWREAAALEVARLRLGRDPLEAQAAPRSVEPHDVDLRPAEDVPPRVMEAMLHELPAHSSGLARAVRAWLSGDASALSAARRHAHTLKGDANTVGVRGLANLGHVLEDVLDLIDAGACGDSVPPPLADALDIALDLVEDSADHLAGRCAAPAGLLQGYRALVDWEAILRNGGLEAPSAEAETALAAADDMAGMPAMGSVPAVATEPAAEPTEAAELRALSVPAALLNQLQSISGEGLIAIRQLDNRVQSLVRAQADQRTDLDRRADLLARLDDLVALRGSALDPASRGSDAEVDPLELDQYNELYVLSRQLIEAEADRRAQSQRFETLLAEMDELRVQLERFQQDGRHLVLRARMLPFAQLESRLQRVARQASRDLGKSVRLELSGGDIALEAELLDALGEPLAHLVRNAVDHGIESSEARVRAGKRAEGTIVLSASAAGDMVQIHVSDDGAGLDIDRVLAKARSLGLVAEGQVLDTESAHRLVLLPGFSTRDEVTQLSGRGVGMDIVHQRVREAGGRLQIESEPGRGTGFRLLLPRSQASANVLVLAAGDERLAVLAAGVERILMAAEVELEDDGRHARWNGEHLPVLALAELLDGRAFLVRRGEPTHLMLVRRDVGQRLLVRTPLVQAAIPAVIKALPRRFPALPGVRGLTLLGDGGTAPVVDIGVLVDAREGSATLGDLALEAPTLPMIVVADDSLSVRRALTELLQGAGFGVIAARDGIEAIEAIREHRPVAVLVDLEMPRMNGLDVARFVRADQALRHLPVVMISSRTGGRHATMAAEAGVDRLLGKPFDEATVMAILHGLLLRRPAAATATLD
jgi:chemotaxis protein histidine kinase CheA